MPTSTQIRQQFIDFFVDKHGHTAVPSAPVVPHDDPTLLFTNAGMNQFKDVFLGTGKREYTRAVDTQKCIRAGGKHNDLEDVGKDTYHHTFFEMLGNWSFGDYFKKEAIRWAWELLIDVWKLDPDRLHATYFEGDESEGLEPDTQARDMWLALLPADRVHPGNKKDNFWEMGEAGPCGPCSEIHYDRTPDKNGGKLVNADSPLVIEIWNLVFIQFNRSADGKLATLPARHVDTGMGFERITAVLQGVESNYDTDVFAPLFEAIAKVTGASPYTGAMEKPQDIAYRVIADHIRTLTFAITDGAMPSNSKRGSVLRSILRRAVKYGHIELGMKKPFLFNLVEAVVSVMGGVFPEITKNPQQVEEIIREEEELFSKTLDRGIREFWVEVERAFESQLRNEGNLEYMDHVMWEANKKSYQYVTGKYDFVDKRESGVADTMLIVKVGSEFHMINLVNDPSVMLRLVKQYCKKQPVISGEKAFDLYATSGYPLDLTQLMAEERGMTVDVEGYNQAFEKHQQDSKGIGGATDVRQSLVEIVQQTTLPATDFQGYQTTTVSDARLVAGFVLRGDRYIPRDDLQPGEQGAIIVNRTPFYAEAGGQVGDTGVIHSGSGAVFKVTDTLKLADAYFHLGQLESGSIRKGQPSFGADDTLVLEVATDRRIAIVAHHTVTHVMNHKLRAVLGDHVQQKGSLVDEEKTRFDFAHNHAMKLDEVRQVEQMINADITADLPVYAAFAPQEDALKVHGLRAVFGEKYPPTVRVVSIGVTLDDMLANPDNTDWYNFSVEFCGGVHEASTGAIGDFVLVSEEAVAKGVRRLTGVAGSLAKQARENAKLIGKRIDSLDDVNPDTLRDAVADLTHAINEQTLPIVERSQLRDRLTQLQTQLKQLDKQSEKAAAGQVVDQARQIAASAQGNIIVAKLEADGKTLRTAMDVIKKTRPDAAMFLAGVSDDKVALLAVVPQELIDAGLKAGDWVKQVAPVVGGGGGGRPDMAQAGGREPEKVDQALEVARQFASEKI